MKSGAVQNRSWSSCVRQTCLWGKGLGVRCFRQQLLLRSCQARNERL